jgi:hypothetical protein
MGYITPGLVQSPRGRISDLTIIHDDGETSWSLAKMTWDGKENRYAMRWNGSDDDHGIGNPQSRGVPTWFILPDNIGALIEKSLNILK